MDQWISRGTVFNDTPVRRLLVTDQQWQIYDTRNKSFLLAVKKDLFRLWCEHFPEIEDIFSVAESDKEIMTFVSTGSYLIASLDKGPYPENSSQLEAFAVAYSKASKDLNLKGAIYIEEYSLLLPITYDGNTNSNDVVFGKWITGGVEISAHDTEAIRNLTSWVPTQTLYKTMELADIDVAIKTDKRINFEEFDDTKNENNLPTERFVLVGRRELETFINDHIVDVLKKPDEYKRMGIGFPGATILYGPPGSGKTFAVEKLADYLDWPRYDINSESIGSPYIHETGKKIAQIFDEAIRNAPSVVIIDEMESFLSAREGKEQHHVEEVAEFLRKIPEAIDNHVLVFAMTNILDSIDPAIRRRGRFDYIIEVGMASKDEIKNLLEVKTSDLPVDDDVDLDAIADALAGRPLSDVSFVIREAGRNAVKVGIDKINGECFEKALSMVSEKETKNTSAIGFRVD